MERIFRRTVNRSLVLGAALVCATLTRAQWQTQSVVLKPGWNAVYLHVDLQHSTMSDLFGSTPVTEVWLWKPDLSTLQFVKGPQVPLDTNSRWLSWKKAFPLDATFDAPIGNAAYLIRLSESETSNYTLNLKGKPVPPRYFWSSDGTNFIGFSTVETGAPSFFDFFEPVSDLRFGAEIFQYNGGPIAGNPQRIFDQRSETVNRGEAFWIRAEGTYNRYFAPFSLELQDSSGVDFGPQGSTYRIRLSNHTAEPLEVTLAELDSESAPSGEPAIAGTPEVLVRGDLDVDTLSHVFTRLSADNSTWTLAPTGTEGSSVEIILGLDRAAMVGGAEGDLFAGLLRFTDSLGFAQYDLPVRSLKGGFAGLWVGEASVSQVRHNLGFFDRSGDEAVKTGEDTEFGGVARAFKIRLIVHVAADGRAHLLQRVFAGVDDALAPVLTTLEGNLSADHLELARRISAPNLPFSESNLPWDFTGGAFDLGETLTTTVSIGAGDQRSNPFLHTYHPDHDNRNATFDADLASGIESFSIDRILTLAIDSPGSDFSALTSSSFEMGGTYGEVITVAGSGPNTNTYEVQGAFLLTRISDNPTLLTTLSE